MGRIQAECLGEAWANVRIDALYSSTLERAYDTAAEIAKHNIKHPDIEQMEILVEQKYGTYVADMMARGAETRAMEALTGRSSWDTGPPIRSHRPPNGGESLQDVATRASRAISGILLRNLVKFDEPPKSFVDNEKVDMPEELPDGVPHVVIVSHNIFLTELYEELLCWNTDPHYHKMTTCQYGNTGW